MLEVMIDMNKYGIIPKEILRKLEKEADDIVNSGDEGAIYNEILQLKKENWLLQVILENME